MGQEYTFEVRQSEEMIFQTGRGEINDNRRCSKDLDIPHSVPVRVDTMSEGGKNNGFSGVMIPRIWKVGV